jgi:hypothetical protein
MANIINADNGAVSGSAGLKSSADSTGVLSLQTNGTTAVSISTGQVVTLTNALAVTSGGTGVTTSTGSGSVVLGTSPTLTTPNINSAQIPTVSGTASLYMARAWVNFSGVGSTSIKGSGNVSSVTYVSAGKYTVNFTTAMPDANYVVLCTCAGLGNSGGGRILVENSSGTGGTLGRTASAVTVLGTYSFSNPGSGTDDNAYSNSVAIFR